MTKTAAVFLLLTTLSQQHQAFAQDNSNVNLDGLGTNSLAHYNYEWDVEINDDCDYTFTVKFSHDESFPVGTPGVTCLPGEDDENGIPYLTGRWFWERLPHYARTAIGIDHVSIDYNPCGHPGDGFLTAHYDLHYYTVSPEFRATVMTCTLLPGTPVCDDSHEAQTTNEGRGFFSVARTADTGTLVNMPELFDYNTKDAVIHMGLHAWDFVNEPKTTDDWVEPVYVICQYDGSINAVEPMLPFMFVSGTQDKFFQKDLTYVLQTIPTLPYYYSVAYDAASHRTTVVTKGASSLCKAEYEAAKLIPEGGTGGGSQSSAFSWNFGTFPLLLTMTSFVVMAFFQVV